MQSAVNIYMRLKRKCFKRRFRSRRILPWKYTAAENLVYHRENKAESSNQVILLNKPDKLLLQENQIKQKPEISALPDIWDFKRLRNRKTFTERITCKVITSKNWVLFKLLAVIEFVSYLSLELSINPALLACKHC